MTENRKTASIAIQLNRSFQMARLGNIFSGLLAIILAACIAWVCAVEGLCGAQCEPFMQRGLSFSVSGQGFFPWLKSAVYFFTDQAGIQHSYSAGDFLSGLFWCCSVLIVLELLAWIASWKSQRNQLRSYLKPIDEIALSAEKIANQSFDTSKFRSFEDAIAQIDAPDTQVQVHDSDLAGLEAAVNNMLKRLQASARMQTRFVDDASHELRTPIAVIQGYVNMLDRWGKDDPQVLRESISAIKVEAEHMKTLVEQLLFLARGDMGRQHFSSSAVSLQDLIKEIYEESQMIDETHSYSLDAPIQLTVQADPAMLKQSIRILVDNAAKYTEANGEITLRLRKENNEARIDVQDSGIGIGANDAPHVFERFYRSDTARKKGGSGLGLSIAQWIIDQHGGHIELVSFEGVGTRISIRLPLQAL